MTTSTIPFLDLGQIKHDRKVGKLLPQDIACQCHALPVSCDGNQIIVAISYPDDKTVMSVVSTAIGHPVSFVWADASEIDHRLEEIYRYPLQEMPHLLLWSSSQADEIRTSFSKDLAVLLGAMLYQVDSQHFAEDPRKGLCQSIDEIQPDLVILEDLDSFSSGKRRRSMARRLIRNTPVSMLIPNQPRWPLKEILLVLGESDPIGDPGRDPAIEWVCKLALASKAAVKILVFLPPVPMMYGQAIQHSIPALLRSNDPLGKKVQWLSEHFARLGIKGEFSLRLGDLEGQIWSEISGSDPDLVVIAEDSESLPQRLLTHDVVNSLIKFADCPVLFARN